MVLLILCMQLVFAVVLSYKASIWGRYSDKKEAETYTK